MAKYIKHVKSIAEALSIEKESVGVKYTDEAPGVEIEAGSYTVCGAILAASEGKVILLSEDRCACSGGKTHLGLTRKSQIPWKMLVEEMKGSLCWSMITYPLVSGNFNVSIWDISARRMERWDPNIIAASIPWERLRVIAEAVEFSTAGRVEPSEKFERMAERMRTKR